jgi:hypothetical protein
VSRNKWQTMSDRYLDVSTIPTIQDKNSWTTFVDEIEKTYEGWESSCRSCWRHYQKWIILGIVVLVLGTAVVLVIVSQSAVPSYPCLAYDSNTLASSISVPCLQYIWNQACKSTPYTFKQGYTGWWNQSPEGAKMVRCHGTAPCGAGTYGNILIYMQSCQINYGT